MADVVVVRVDAVVGTFESEFTAAAAAIVYAVVVEVVAVPARCRPPASNLQPRCLAKICFIRAHTEIWV